MNKKYPILPIEIIAAFQEKDLPENFCIVPFSNLIFNPNGDVGVCRQKGTKHVVGNIQKQSIEQIWNGEYLQRWREEFLSGDVKICKDEIARDACHLGADNYQIWPEITFSKEQPFPFLKLTANFNGQCNLRCRMCDIWMMQNGLYDQIGFWEQAREDFFPYIKEIELLSGEPFIQKDTYRLIDEISAVNPECTWSFTTNGHWKLNDWIKGKLDKIKIRNIILSVDSLDPVEYAEIRRDGNLEVVIDNMKRLKNYEQQRLERGDSALGLTMHYLVMKDNWHGLSDVLSYVDSLGFRVIFNNLYEPKEYAISSLAQKDQLGIIDYYLENYTETEIARCMRVIMAILNDIEPVDKAVYLDRLSSHLSHA